MIRTPRLVIAGTHSGVGKTTIATALMAAFTRRGLRVQPFKVGPDFIDPGFHQVACGRLSRNLDGWMLSRATNMEVFARAATDADLAIIEGVMGLFDGRNGSSEEGSTAEMAKWLNAPVLLAADASAMARSAAALVCGFEAFDHELHIAGVLFNRIGGRKHAEILREVVAAYCRSEYAGSLPRNEKITLPSRHLGLTMAGEVLGAEHLSEMARWVEENLDLDSLLKKAQQQSQPLAAPEIQPRQPGRSSVRVGVARDAAFCFYYEDNLDLLRENGAELVEFSPTSDSELPPGIHGLYLGGGYPELHAAELSSNQAMLRAVREFAQSGAPVYAECGGFMYLGGAIIDAAGQEYPMAGIFPSRARMQPRLAALGYLEAECVENALWLSKGDRLRGHEFRYSEIDGMPPDVARCWLLRRNGETRKEGYRAHSVIAGYAHLHFGSCPAFAAGFVQACVERQSIRKAIQ